MLCSEDIRLLALLGLSFGMENANAVQLEDRDSCVLRQGSGVCILAEVDK